MNKRALEFLNARGAHLHNSLSRSSLFSSLSLSLFSLSLSLLSLSPLGVECLFLLKNMRKRFFVGYIHKEICKSIFTLWFGFPLICT